jgi:hypothetical protein
MGASTQANRVAGIATFRCGHPRTPENSTRGYLHANGKRYPQCALCDRIRTIVEAVDRQLASWKRGDRAPTLGQRISRGLVR